MQNPKVFFAMAVALAAVGCTTNPRLRPYSTLPQVQARDPRAAANHNEKGLQHIESGEYEAAEEDFRRALEADLFYGPAHNNLALTLIHKGHAYEAAWECQFAARLLPNAAEPRNNLGLIMEKVADVDAAIEHYEAALKLDPNSVEVMGHLARAHVKNGEKPRKLRGFLKRLIFQNPGGTWDQWARSQLLSMNANE